MAPIAADEAPVATTSALQGLCGRCIVVDGERLTVEDTVVHAVVAGRISDDFLDHGCDTYWCVNPEGRHRIVRASELVGAA
jgi:hypothetical protein